MRLVKTTHRRRALNRDYLASSERSAGLRSSISTSAATGRTTSLYIARASLTVRAGEIDVTELIGRDHNWPNYHDAPAIAAAIAPFVYFMDRDALSPARATPAASVAAPSR